MTLRSKLFATVALPVLSVSLVVEPALAAGNQAGHQGTWLMAQALEGDLDGDGQLSPEEQQLLQQQKQGQPEEQAPAEEPQPEPEQAPAEEPQPEPEQAPAEEPQPEPEQAPAEEPQPEPEQAPAEEPQPEPEQAPAEEPQPEPEQAPAEELQPEPEQAPAEEPQPEPEQAPAEEPQPEPEQAPAEEPQPEPEQAPAEEPQAQPEEQAPAEEPQAQPEEQAPAEEPQAKPEEQAPAEEPQAQPEEQAPAEEPQAQPEEQAPAEEPQAQPEGQAPAEQPSTDQQGAEQPATEQPDAADTDAAVPPVEDKLTVEEKQKIAEDPSKTSDTVVLPVDNGAAVLDSDKDADLTGGAESRETRSKEREQVEVAPPPETDADAQAALPVLEPAAVNKVLEEKGKKVEQAPAFQIPGVTNVNNNVTNNTVNNTVVNNNTTNNTVVNNVTQVNTVTVIKKEENTTILNVGNHIVVRSDDRERLRMDSNDSFYEQLSRGRSRETIVRPDGTRLVTVYNRYGDIIQRSRVTPDGDEYVMIYAPEADSEEPRRIYDAGYDLPPMRLTVPVDDYIVSTSREPREDYYAFLEKPPVEKVERVYSIDEVRYSARIRDKVRRIDLDTITFATGSAEVPLNQAKTLRKVASAMLKVLKKDPGETFLIEGHTDAVGSDQSNLILSDKRADSVAALLTDVYGIPPENLVTQGYGERYLKIRTASAEQQNRRVTIRRVTPLIRPVAQK
ncbi:OmpA family protein [Gellertiella hungarica]|uniref:Outer membrane protein OmpA-like peptidoglycan-associated protein n=1 Tax=Gellertiella hungarica TaxID=1572859 RepID=A0A7W6J4D4_9HYPH|nr:OmpA family protein [Gellertiella hungarica]MBB4064560.1 outer membrane protein OmpA-like peptidoglycan-associated protein [Gellertiella hungarica]